MNNYDDMYKKQTCINVNTLRLSLMYKGIEARQENA